MTRRFGVLVVLALLQARPCAAAVTPAATASPGSVPGGITYNGRLDQNGQPFTGALPIVFRVYDADAGGAELWISTQEVTFSQGLFTVLLPVSTAALSGGGARWLEVEVNGQTLSPREVLSSVPYALVARTVEGSLDISHGGLSVSSAPSGGLSLFVSSQTGYVGIGTSSPQSPLDVRGVIGGGGSSGLFIDAAGNVGVGTTAPVSPLTVAGDVRISGGGNGLIFPDGSLMTSQGVGSASALANAADALIQSDSGALGVGDVVVKTGPSERLRLTNSGLLGIGTSSPASKLHLSSGSVILDGAGAALSVAGRGLVVAGGTVAIGTETAVTTLEVNGAAQFGLGAAKSTFTAQGALQLVSGATIAANGTLTLSTAPSAAETGAPALFIDAAGRLAVGHAAPAARLDVAGDLQVGTGTAKSTITSLGHLQLAAGSTITFAGTLSFSTAASGVLSGVPALFIDAGGRVGVGTTIPGSRLHVADGDLLISGTPLANGIIFQDGSFQATAAPSTGGNWTVSGTSIYPAASGNVGIGTTAPAAKLDLQEIPANAYTLKVGTNASSYHLVVRTNGRVGIGSSDPQGLLHVRDGDVLVGANAPHDLTAGDDLFVSGNVVVDGDLVANQAGTVARFTSMGVGGAVSPPAQLLNVGAGVLTVLSAGNVGVGTTGPLAPLSLVGADPAASDTTMALFGDQQWRMKISGGDETNSGTIDYRGFDANSLSIVGAGTAVGNRNVRVFDSLSVGYSANSGVAAFNGSVGVGTSNPQSTLDVRGIIGGGGAGGIFIKSNGFVGIGTTDPQTLLDVRGIIGGGGSTGLTVDSSGRVGIGLTNPSVPLDISGTAVTGLRYVKSSADARITVGDPTRSWSMAVGRDSPGTFSIVEEGPGSSRLTILTGGNVGIGATNPGNALSVPLGASFGGNVALSGAEPIEAQGAGAGISMYDRSGGSAERWVIYSDRTGGAGTNTLRFWSGSDLLNITPSGSVGIGTSAPAAKVEIVSASASTLRLRAAAAGSVELFTAVGDGTARTGTALCQTVAAAAVCLGHWNSTGTNQTCAASIANGRVLCSDFGN